MAAAVSNRAVDETITRVTKEGRKLTYCLTVIQQPERARACGSGAKSSADRRPVDPPPVVELRIFEGEADQKSDVTFSYNANFFLFATLEVARPIAHGRVQPSAPQIPVLTGMPVSGMAYLDRPKEAGYFIFPDLSVRHEGKYRLSFNLYEETKEAKDADAEPSNDANKPPMPGGAGAPDSSFDWRLEVKSATFTVFSAKKFPGLAESTVLSRTVAEQGCRVRIRRDVRMRRRDGKTTGDYDDAAEDEYVRGGRKATPSAHDQYRERSLSHHSEDRQPFPDTQRRMSGEYPPPPCYQYTPSPVTPHSSTPQSYLTFGNASAPQYSAPAPPQFVPPQPPAPPSYPPAPASYPHGGAQFRQPPPPPTNYYTERQPYPQPVYPNHPPREQRESYEPEYRRGSTGYAPPGPPPPPQVLSYPAADSSFGRSTAVPPYAGYPARSLTPSMSGPVNLAPLKMPIEPKYEVLTSPPGPLSSVGRMAPPLPSPSYDRPSSFGRLGAALPAPTEAARNGKRSYDSVFSSSISNEPLYNGMRPSSPHGQGGFEEDDDSMSLEQLKMQYKRADGSSYSRELPVLE